MQWLWCGVSGEVVANMLILARQKTIVAIVALGNIDYQIPLFHKVPTGKLSFERLFPLRPDQVPAETASTKNF